MKNKAFIALFSVVAAAIVCIVAVLGINMISGSSPSIAPEEVSVSDYENTYNNMYNPYESTTEETKSSWFESLFGSTEEQSFPSTLFSTELSETVTESETSAEETTLTEKATQLTTLAANAFKQVFKMPVSPQYIPPDTKLDIANINLASYRYYPEGNYYYTDDKECWQKNFGFNEVYDKFAPITMMYYDTVRTIFDYDGKEWLVQMWKGQYGYCFVGGEVGIYTRRPGSGGTHFACADKEDWLNMEMAFVWDEFNDGNYSPIFTRPYEKYWWCTGFVVGFPNKNIVKTREEFRLVTHITFKDSEMADAFCNAFSANGFKRVSKLDNNEIDTFVQVGNEVAFVWQNVIHE